MGKKGKIGKQRKDKFYHLAKETGYRSRAAFKLIQLNRKFEFLQKSKVLIDLCAAPGGWLQVAQKHMPVPSIIIGVDLAPIKPIHNVITLQEDITTSKCRSLLSKELKTWKVDIVLNDGAPNVGKSWLHDAFEQNRLTLSALHLACDFLIKGGWFVTKVFRSKDYNALMWVFKKLFQRVHATKPQASRNESAEIFVVCQNFIAPDKIDPKFFDPTYVFAEIKEKEQKMSKADLFKPLIKPKKPKAEGYEDGNISLYTKIKVSDFIQSPDFIELLSKANEIVMDSSEVKNHPSTTGEILECLKDLKVLGRKELTMLMDWRKEVRSTLVKKSYNDQGNEELEMNVDNNNENEDDEVDEIETELSEEAQKLKRKKRKVAKEKRKIEERLALKMVIKNDQLVQEEQDLFNLKNIRKASQLNAIKDVEPNHEDDNQVNLDVAPKKKRIQVDKESDEKYFDPDDSDGAGSDDDDDDEQLILSEVEDQEDDDDESENGILVDLEDKDERVDNITKMFFENKIFHRLGSDSAAHGSTGHDLDDDDDIELEELENRISNVTKGKAKAENEGKKEKTASQTSKPTRKVTFDDDDDESNSSDSDEEGNKEGQGSKLNQKALTPEELALGALMIKSKKTKRDLLDNGWNRFVHEDDDFIPSWFRKEEEAFYRKPVPVSSDMVKEYNDKLRDINSRPIKKVMEAKARKKKRTLRRLEKARIRAETVTDEADMTNKEKAQYIRSIYKKAVRKDKDNVQMVVGKRQFGNRRPPGVKGRYKVVDSRLKKDKRNQAKSQKGGKKGRSKPSAPKGKGAFKSKKSSFKNKSGGKGKGKGRK